MKHSEFQLIDQIRNLQRPHPAVQTGIGDDAAILTPSGSAAMLVATDLLLDGIHFRLSEIDPRLAGRKALAVNLSDLAAMGGAAQTAFVSLVIPNSMTDTTLEGIWKGLQDLADEFNIAVAGGDTNIWDGAFAISVTVTGTCPHGVPICRDGASVGDWIFVTGQLGGSILGRHLNFTPRLIEAEWLTKTVQPTSMIDISDGLAADLHHILDESHVSAELVASAIPIHPDASRLDGEPLNHAISDGEDFELLFTLPESRARALLSDSQESLHDLDCGVAHIGIIRDGSGCQLRHSDGSLEDLPPRGWVHGNSTPS